MSEQPTPYQYTASDFTRYYTGKMDKAEMHALEKAALDDPFLFEAMEGYSGFQEEDWTNELATISSKLNAPVAQAKIVPFKQTISYKWWKVAAAVLILVSSIGITYWMTGNAKKPGADLATIQSPVPEKAPAASTPMTVDSVQTSNTAHNEVAPVMNTTNNKVDDKNIASVVKPESKQIQQPLANADDAMNDEKAVTPAQHQFLPNKDRPDAGKQIVSAEPASKFASPVMEKSDYKISAKQIPAPATALSKSEADKEITNSNPERKNISDKVFTGYILSAKHQPIPYAHVKILHKHTNSYANKYGTIHLPVEDSVLDVEFSALGYSPMKTTIHLKNDHHEFVLNEHRDHQDNSNKDVAESNKTVALARKSIKKTKNNLSVASPTDGWALYDIYLENNKTTPYQLSSFQLHPSVTLEFDVDNEGDISNIKVVQSTCHECEAEAIRLLQDGPDWELDHGLVGKGRLEVGF